MTEFIFYIITAIVFTFAMIKTSYEEAKKICSICAFLWWLLVVIKIFEFLI